MNKKTIKDIDVKGKKVLVRVDFNVPLSKENKEEIADDARIKAAIPTIDYLLENGACVILMSHLGRPKGENNADFSLKPVANWLENHYGEKFHFLASDLVVDDKVKDEVESLNSGELSLLENTRFVKGETKNDESFAKDSSFLVSPLTNLVFSKSESSPEFKLSTSSFTLSSTTRSEARKWNFSP